MPHSETETAPSLPVVDERVGHMVHPEPALAEARLALLAISRAYLLGPVPVPPALPAAPTVRGPSSAVIRKERQRQRLPGHRMAAW